MYHDHTPPDCLHGGSHRWREFRWVKESRDIQYRECRTCGESDVRQWGWKDGRPRIYDLTKEATGQKE